MEIDLKIVLVEDETIIAEYFKTLVEKKGHNVELLFEATPDFETYLRRSGANLVFLDINLETEMSGLDLAKICHDLNIPFIFITSYSDSRTIESAMKYEPLAYILKPFTEEEIFKTLEIAKIKLTQSGLKKSLLLKSGYDSIRLPLEEILWLKADNVYTEIVTKSKTYVQRHTLKEMYDKVPHDVFLKIHRSYIVNTLAIQKVAYDYVEIGASKIPLSRSRKTELVDFLNR